MDKEKQRIAIAEACGWKFELCNNPTSSYKAWIKDGVWHEDGPPDYLNDLNAMHEAWNIEPPKPFTDKFNFQCELAWQLELIVKREFEKNPNWPRPGGLDKWEELIWTAKEYLIANATAAQRAEAFLRTLGLWEG